MFGLKGFYISFIFIHSVCAVFYNRHTGLPGLQITKPLETCTVTWLKLAVAEMSQMCLQPGLLPGWAACVVA